MTLNTNKCNLLLNRQEPNKFKIGDLHINSPLSEKLIDITFNCKLEFNKYIEDICQKSITEFKSIAPYMVRLAPYMGTTKNSILPRYFLCR